MTTPNHSVILGGVRTPFTKLNGGLSTKRVTELGAIVIRAALEQAGVDAAEVQHVVMGQVLQGGAGQNPARQAAFGAGLARTTTAETVNRVCGSGMLAIEQADLLIRAGDHQVVVAGGMESMSNAPYALGKARGGYRMGDGVLEDLMFKDGLLCAVCDVQMGTHGDNVAAEIGVGREEQDAWALRSHETYFAAKGRGVMAEEIVPVQVQVRKGPMTIDTDEAPRRDTNLEALANLRPVFSPDGTVTAGNAPGINDGAAALVVTSASWAAAHNLSPRATILARGVAGWDAPYLAYTPEMAARIALDRAGLTPDDLDLVEINEAFASVAITASRRLGVDPAIVNVNGGAVALGHPIGASGARITLALINELHRRGGGIGLAAICSGGGQGDALIVRVDGA